MTRNNLQFNSIPIQHHHPATNFTPLAAALDGELSWGAALINDEASTAHSEANDY